MAETAQSDAAVLKAAGRKESSRNEVIDAARFFAACGVVFIHTADDTLTNVAAEVARFAVPFFFMLSGYFLPAELSKDGRRIARKLTERIGSVYLVWVAIYLLANLALHFWTPKLPMFWELTLKGGAGGHLWYLSSMIQGAILLIILRPLGWTAVLSIAGILYGVDLLIGTYGEALPTNPGWNSRWGPAVGLLFLAIGRYLAEHPVRVPIWASASACLIFLVLDFAELQFVIKAIGYNEVFGVPDIRIMTVPYGIAAFLFVLELSRQRWDGAMLRFMADLGRVALGIYAVHLLVIKALQQSSYFASQPLVTALVTIVLSTSVAFAASKIPAVRRLFV